VSGQTTRERLRSDLSGIVSAALAGVAAPQLVSRALDSPPAALVAGRLWLVSAGKAAVPMARTFADWTASRLAGGVVVAPQTSGTGLGHRAGLSLEHLEAGHPRPDAQSERAARRALETADQAKRAGGTLVVLLSGGASSLMALPAPGVLLDDKAAVAQALMNAGAAIDELNTVRKHLSAIKGGRLAAAAGVSVTLAISDVVAPVADDPAVIGSGPTVADPTTFADAVRVIERRGLKDRLPPRARAALEEGVRGGRDESIKPGDPRLAQSDFQVIGRRTDALAAARRAAERRGFGVFEMDLPTVGEAADAGARLMASALDRSVRTPARFCLLAAGETVVTVRGHGHGGRNQELTLGALLEARTDRSFVVASVGTDGIDGPTDAAGAVADETTLERARSAGLADPQHYLVNNDSYHFFEPLGDLIKTGPTATNVGDLQVILLA